MPLSEHEQRLLDQIERALYQDDPKFATSVRSSDLRTHTRRRLVRAGLVLGLGVVLLLVGVSSQLYFVGILGFVVMLGALLLALASWRRLGTPQSSSTLRSVDAEGRVGRARKTDRPARRKSAGSGGGSASLLGRLEERWNKRWDERGRGQ